MGSNRRDADKIDRQMQKRIQEVEMRPRFDSLPPELSDIYEDRSQPAREPIQVSVWVPVTAGKIRVDAEAVEWNRKAARVV